MTFSEAVANINRVGWSNIRWAYAPLTPDTIKTIIKGDDKAEYFVAGAAVISQLQHIVEGKPHPLTHFYDFNPVHGEDKHGTLMGFPVYMHPDMPRNNIALISPSVIRHAGTSYEHVYNTSSMIQPFEGDA